MPCVTLRINQPYALISCASLCAGGHATVVCHLKPSEHMHMAWRGVTSTTLRFCHNCQTNDTGT
jgi:hypothetical protein